MGKSAVACLCRLPEAEDTRPSGSREPMAEGLEGGSCRAPIVIHRLVEERRGKLNPFPLPFGIGFSHFLK